MSEVEQSSTTPLNSPQPVENTPLNSAGKPPSASSSPALWISIIGLALAFAATILGCVIWMQFSGFRLGHTSFADNLKVRDIQLAIQLNNVRQQLAEQQQVNLQTQAALEHLYSINDSNSAQWSVSEVEYLLYLANVTLQTQRNIPTTLNLLQAADHLLADLGNPDLLNVRQLVAKDIAALQEVPITDTAGLYLRLQALSNNVKHLPFLNNAYSNPKPTTSSNTPSQSAWKRAWENTLSTLKQTIIIQHHKQSFKPLLTNLQQRYFYQYLQTLFSQAQTALLQEQPQIYQASLQQLSQLIATYFVTDNAATQQMLQALQQLAVININPPLPNISDSLNALKNFSHTQLEQDLPSLSSNNASTTNSPTNKGSK